LICFLFFHHHIPFFPIPIRQSTNSRINWAHRKERRGEEEANEMEGIGWDELARKESHIGGIEKEGRGRRGHTFAMRGQWHQL
jgi:hypothetical protein